MIRGLDAFKEFFGGFQDQYVLIGGAACDLVFNEADLDFRATKDFDMVLLVEALTPEFGRRFWDFVGEGGYENRVKSNGAPQFYRFDKPKSPDFPFMIELFARSESVFDKTTNGCRLLHLGDEVSSLSAILLNNDYYQLLLTGKTIVSDVPILPHTHLVLFKAKAFLDLSARKAAGQQIKEKDKRKHKNDVARLSALLTGNESCIVPESILADLMTFIDALEKEPPDLRALGLPGVSVMDVTDILKSIYTVSS